MQPMMRAPFNGWFGWYLRRNAIRAGISDSAKRISLRPNSASWMFATL
jgi:hypothetical protein